MMVPKNKKSSAEYWERRIGQHTWKTYNSIEDKNIELLEFYQDANRNIKTELYFIAEKYSKDGVLSRTDMYRQNHLQKLYKRIEDIIKQLGQQTQQMAQNNMSNGCQSVYRNALDQLNAKLPKLESKLNEELLDRPWRGEDFSSLLWKNQQKLAAALNESLLLGIQQGKTVAEMAIALNNIMGQGFNAAHRLVRTETMHYLNSAALQGYKDAGVKYVRYWAAEDERTCPECAKYHGKVFPIDEAPLLPLHPNCRCTYLPVDGIIKPDKIVSGHSGTPKRSNPGAVIDHTNRKNNPDVRSIYGKNGLKEKDINTTDHGNPKHHPYGTNGEHVHDYEWDSDGRLKNKTTRDLTDEEREEHGDIL